MSISPSGALGCGKAWIQPFPPWRRFIAPLPLSPSSLNLSILLLFSALCTPCWSPTVRKRSVFLPDTEPDHRNWPNLLPTRQAYVCTCIHLKKPKHWFQISVYMAVLTLGWESQSCGLPHCPSPCCVDFSLLVLPSLFPLFPSPMEFVPLPLPLPI